MFKNGTFNSIRQIARRSKNQITNSLTCERKKILKNKLFKRNRKNFLANIVSSLRVWSKRNHHIFGHNILFTLPRFSFRIWIWKSFMRNGNPGTEEWFYSWFKRYIVEREVYTWFWKYIYRKPKKKKILQDFISFDRWQISLYRFDWGKRVLTLRKLMKFLVLKIEKHLRFVTFNDHLFLSLFPSV